MDLRTLRPDGVPWDFTRAKDRAWALRMVREQKPRWIIAAPPCTSFSVLNWNLNYPRMSKEEVSRRVAEGLTHLKFVCKLYSHQIMMGNFFLHEHPQSAKSWDMPPIKRLLSRHDVHVVRCHQCQFEAKSATGANWKDSAGDKALVLKPTKFMSNSVQMLRRLHRLCKGGHPHQPLLGGRAAGAAFYPVPLMKAILQGMTDTEHANDVVQQSTNDEYVAPLTLSMYVANPASGSPRPKSSKPDAKRSKFVVAEKPARKETPTPSDASPSELPRQDGGSVTIRYELSDFK